MAPHQSLRQGCSRAHCACRPLLMRCPARPRPIATANRLSSSPTARRSIFTSASGRHSRPSSSSSSTSSYTTRPIRTTAASLAALGSLLVFSLSPHSRYIHLDAGPQGRAAAPKEPPQWAQNGKDNNPKKDNDKEEEKEDDGTSTVEAVTDWFREAGNVDWSGLPDRIADRLLPEWSKMLPGYIRKLQRELDSVPGSLADEIWREAHDPTIHPEVQFGARVRVSDDLCQEEQAFRSHRKPMTAKALHSYLGLPASETVHPDDVPVIALCGSGGGLRALVAGTGSLMAAAETGLFDCATYTAGVSGSCWLQAMYFSSFTHQDFTRVAEHLRARLGVHIAHPPELLMLLTTAPTNKFLLSGPVERFKADPSTRFGLVDVYGTLLAARLLIPRGELGVSSLDFKVSNQRRHLTRGQNPMPIYTAVRHEIPDLEENGIKDEPSKSSKSSKSSTSSKTEIKHDNETPKKDAWFQWFEITPYEFFCEEFAAGIPTWAMGRNFHKGQDVPLTAQSPGGDPIHYHLPEVRMPLMLGIFGSAFCATLSHYYKEIRPVVQSLSGMAGLDELIWGRNDDLSKVHPIEPATLPNPVFGMDASQLPVTVPPGLLERPHIQLMDAGMSNNLPLYPFMRPGRGVEVIVVFDASADIRKDNWLYVADGYARRRGVKGWPVGAGWPPSDEPPAKTAQELEEAGASSTDTADDKLSQAMKDQAEKAKKEAAKEARREAAKASSTSNKGGKVGGRKNKEKKDNGKKNGSGQSPSEAENAKTAAKELGYCTVWVGSTSEKVSTAEEAAATEPAAEGKEAFVSSAPIDESTHWRLTDPDAGLTLVYMPYLANESKVPGVDPATSDFMSTWNFVYRPEEVDKAVALARANFAEGEAQIKATVRAVYERKKKLRLVSEKRLHQALMKRIQDAAAKEKKARKEAEGRPE
ncbi:hypothetical protein SBRCBS47491_001270 [Sporothrix bragantina]|uniref:Lysophospholipase n=1 Tax=Sporothrix bragantina TaxID=671064 RepID=A0ABP0AX70_9PEZI